ncbi:MAG: DUF481 domain-containing protein [Pontiellaceae bacterium]
MKSVFNSTFLIFLFFLLLSSQSLGKKSKNQANLGASIRSGTINSSLITIDIKNEVNIDNTDWINTLYFENGKTADIKTEGLVRISSEYRLRFKNPKYFGSVFTQGTHDIIRDVNYRIQLGPNIGYYLFENDKLKIDISAGLNVTTEKVEKINTYTAYRFSTRLNYRIGRKSSVYSNIELNGDVNNLEENFNSLTVIGIKSGIYDTLSLFTEIRNDYDDKPTINNIDKNELLLTIGFAYIF